jgi:hypothetical protein
MSEICGKLCPVDIAITHTNEILAGIDDSDFAVAKGMPTRAEKVEKWASTAYDADIANQSCERSCKVLRAMVYSATVGGTGIEVLTSLPHFDQEI